MNTATQPFRISTRPRFFLGTFILDVIDAHPVLSLALITAGCAMTFALVVLS